jgi:hypothetical protein
MHRLPSGFVTHIAARSRLLVGLLAATSLLVFVAPASAASLSTTVSPRQITIGHRFTLTIKGISDPDPTGAGQRQAVQVWSQKASTRCAATSSLENARSYSSVRLRTYVNPGAFNFVKHVRTRVLGTRRICAYLDTGPNTSPVLTAGTTYKVVLPLCTRTRRHNCRRH